MAFLEKIFLIISKPYQLWTNFQKQKQFEKNTKKHMAILNRAIDEFIFLLTKGNNNQEHKERTVKIMKIIYRLTKLLNKDILLCSKKMQRKLYNAIVENNSLLETYKSF